MRRLFVFALLFTLLAPLSLEAQSYPYHAGDTIIVTASSTAIRSSPSATASVVAMVVQGDLLEIARSNYAPERGVTWWNVREPKSGTTGWLVDSAFTISQKPVIPQSTCWTPEQITEIDGVLSIGAPPTTVIDPTMTYIATIETSVGAIALRLDPVDSPIATNNFVCLADIGYYDGTSFHRIADDLLIQGGDASGTGTGTPGYTVRSDTSTGDYPAGSIALANSKPNENGSQFFIAVTDLTGLIPDDYPVFGHVVAGQDVVTTISRGSVELNPRGEMSQPVDPVAIISVNVSEQGDEVGPPLPNPILAQAATPIAAGTVEAVALPPVSASTSVIELDAKDIFFYPTEIEINASNLPVTIRMHNTGAAQHNFAIDVLGIDVDVDPGDTVEFQIPVGAEPGTYDFYCNIPGHKEAGMVGTLTIR